jgi:5'-3' exonuclease
MSDKERIFSLFQEFSQEKREELDVDRNLNSDVLIIDGMNTFMRVWSMYPTTNDNGDHIGGYTGFLKSIGHAIRLRKPTRCIVVFDGKGGSARRRKIFPDYKMKKNVRFRVNRALSLDLDQTEESSSMKYQIVKLIQYLNMLPVTTLCLDNVEADDVIALLARSYFSGLGKKCTIMSTDKDFLQLVDGDVTVYSPTKRTIYTSEKICHEYGIHPNNYLLYRTIDGDRGDNIVGMKGVGEKKLKSAFPEFSGETKLNLQDLIKISEDKQKEKPLYKNFLNDDNQTLLKRNYDLMQLVDSILPASMQTKIFDHVDSSVTELNKFEFSKKFAEDQLWAAFPNHHNWLMETWTILNSYAIASNS